ncbi:MAG: ribbon-helix-helix protein, CopG family [Patescibacteria group bacterium]|nr:ribbon-helix-helix protein, CopG family [Patescibacteria group bacterium]MDE1943884.1 ribbon-helix-helix protein, CopG family [Patescibacteria group bacterium]MDE1944962.1 ribbon-helix-helix protein, CopG family [Patescibacteria group bacterium]MDE2057987.1 ribbon-helix-helix protein, CopG family [Patescibacteria group bacterium]
MQTNTGSAAPQEPVRVQFELTDDALRRIEAIQRRSGAQSIAEVVRNALQFHEWQIGVEDQGFNLALVERIPVVRAVVTFKF